MGSPSLASTQTREQQKKTGRGKVESMGGMYCNRQNGQFTAFLDTSGEYQRDTQAPVERTDGHPVECPTVPWDCGMGWTICSFSGHLWS